MLILNLLIDGDSTIVSFNVSHGIIDVIMVDGIPTGVLPVTYINKVKSKIMECME